MNASFGNIIVDTGNPYIDILGLVFIVLSISFGLRWIARYFREKPPAKSG